MPFLDLFEVNYSKAYFLPEMQEFRTEKGVKLHFKSNAENYHFDLFASSDQFVGTMNSGQIVGENDTLFFERTQNNEIVNYTFNLTSEYNSNPTTFEFQTHPSLGLPLTLTTLPNESYSGQGSFTLVDGIRGTLPWKGHEWLGFDTSLITFELDLLETKKLQSLKLGYLTDHNSWIHAPNDIEIYVSKSSRRNWKKLKINNKNFNNNEITLELKGKAQLLKVILKSVPFIPEGMPGEGNTPWTFLDEIIVNTMP
jgi:hypothetical protein